MPASRSAREHLYRLFKESFSVADVAEPLISFDADADAVAVRALMVQRGFDVVGIRREGAIVGYVRRDDLGDGACAKCLHGFDEARVVPDTESLRAVVRALSETPYLFVTVLGRVGGIVTRSDLQKAPVRMWLFGVVTIIEMSLTRLIQEHFDDTGWKEHLSASRLRRADDLLAERRRRNQELELIDCLQFADKGQIVLKDPQLYEKVGFQSRSRGRQTIKDLEALRNNLAHAQDIAADWDTIVQLSENLEHVLSI